MRIEKPGGCNPVKHFLGGGESPFMSLVREAEELEDVKLRACQADVRRIGDVSVVIGKLMVLRMSR